MKQYNPRERIIQSMKVVLAFSVPNGSNTQEFKNEIGTAAASLPSFIDDAAAQRINAIYNDARTRLARKESRTLEQMRAFQEVGAFKTRTMSAGLSLRCELTDFVNEVERLDRDDPPNCQRICTLAGIEYSPKTKRSFGAWFR